uniref:AB hydrolase-1 domain-containing protein n=1 Tax=Rhizochromulina marina TaxID=1034831 RepID=A0A7S2W453_9STRA|mmetsp:Transcript_13589/g.39572  ORF Transcript_13589/g.39572 Transcript_13589/m.39572 type:complete len:720 (+) Transcript_13589:219-2378(+)
MVVLVTGAVGYVGSRIIEALRQSGRFPVVVGTDLQACLPRSVASDGHWGGVDLTQAGAVASLLDDVEAHYGRLSGVVHVAAFPGPAREPPSPLQLKRCSPITNRIQLETVASVDLLLANTLSAHNMFSQCLVRDVPRVVFSSSAFAYGWSHDPTAFRPVYLPMDEEHPLQPCETYGLSKMMGEEVAAMLSRSVRAVVPRTRTSFVSIRFPNMLKREAFETLPWTDMGFGDVEQNPNALTLAMWGYAHEDDVIEAHVAGLTTELPPGDVQAFVVAADDTRFEAPTDELVQRHLGEHVAAEVLGHPKTVAMLSSDLASRLPKRNWSVFSNAKAREFLGLRPRNWSQATPSGSGPRRQSFHSSAAASGQWSTKTFLAGDVELGSGAVLPDCRLVYEVHGALPVDGGRKVTLHPTSFGATHEDLRYRIGPGPQFTLDTREQCVVVVNMLGNGRSTSPYTAGQGLKFGGLKAWPWPSIEDNVRLQKRLLQEELGIAHVDMIFGYSMGAMQALTFAALFPDAVGRVAAVCGAARASNYNKVFLHSLRTVLTADPLWSQADQRFHGTPQTGLRSLGAVWAGWGLSEDFYRQEEFLQTDVGDFQSLEDFVDRGYVASFVGDEAHNLLAMLSTWYDSDIAHAFNGSLEQALGAIQAQVLLMPCNTDRYFSVAHSTAEAELIPRAVLAPIPSTWGHRAGDPSRPGQQGQSNFINKQVRGLLGNEKGKGK